MQSFWNNLLLYSGLISVSVVIGGVVPLFLSQVRRHLHFLLALSAGLMLGATLIHLLPASFELIGKQASLWVLIGFLFLNLFEKFVTVHICQTIECEIHPMGMAAVVGLSAHALTDGIALGSGLLVTKLGFVVFLTILFHKLPEAFAFTTILLHEKQRKAKILFYNLLLIAMVPVGAILVHFLAGPDNSHFTGIVLGLSAGTFLHISLSDLLPHLHEHGERQSVLFVSFLIGIGLMYLLDLMVHHGGLAF